MNDNVLETLERVGTPASILVMLRKYSAEADRVRAQKYQSAKETEELTKLAQTAADRLVMELGKEIVAADADRDKELRALESELAERTRLPAKLMTEADAEYQSKLLRRAIEESRRVAALTLTAVDVQTIAVASDAGEIAAIVEEAIASAPDEAVKRIARAAEARAAVLAGDESRDGGVPGEAFAAHMRIRAMVQRWRGQLPEVRREQILAKHTARVLALRNSVQGAARALRIERSFEQAVKRIALQE